MSRLPHNREAEEILIGAVLLDSTVLGQLDGITGTDFYVPAHSLIWEAITTLAGEGKPVEAAHVTAHLVEVGALDKVGGSAAIAGLIDKAPGTSNVSYWADRVSDASQRRRLIQTAESLTAAGYANASLADLEAKAVELVTANRVSRPEGLLVDGFSFFTEESAAPEPRWGRPGQVLWAQREPLMIAAPTGVGKTTVSQHLAFAMVGIESSVLDFPVTPIDGRLLYIAADRPAQAARSGARLIGSMDEEILRERVRVHKGPIPFNLSTAEPWQFADWIEQTGCVAALIDSLGNIATDLAKDDVGSRVNQAISHVVARGIEVVVNHHDRKKGRDEKRKRPTIDDVYGSQWLTAGMGSVVYLHAQPGDPIATVLHLKSPAVELPPFDILIDHESGVVRRDMGRDPYELLKASNGLTVKTLAEIVYGDSQRANVEKARRQLERLVANGLAVPVKGDGEKSPITYYPATQHVEELLPA